METRHCQNRRSPLLRTVLSGGSGLMRWNTTMIPASSEGLNRETKEAVYFFTPAFDVFNNFSAYTVDIWGRRFPTAEHAFQWKKFERSAPEVAEAVFRAGSPNEAKEIARA